MRFDAPSQGVFFCPRKVPADGMNERGKTMTNELISAREKRKRTLQRTILTALFSALAFGATVAVHFKVMFLTLDFKDAVIAIGGLFLGPVAALIMSALTALIEFVTISNTGVYGLIMNFLSSAAFSVAAALVYKYRKTFSGAIAALCAGVLTMVVTMMFANLIVTPYFMHKSIEYVAGLIPTLLLPFNIIKSVMNAALVALLYKPLTAGVGRIFPELRARVPMKADLKALFLAIGSVTAIVAAILVLFFVFKGKILFGIDAPAKTETQATQTVEQTEPTETGTPATGTAEN